MSVAKIGDSVLVHYTGKLVTGEVFDSSEGREPLGFALGSGNVIPGFEQAVIGMQTGAAKDVVIPADEAYGDRHEQLIQTVQREQMQLGVEPEIGMTVELHREDGTVIPLLISAVTETTVTVDGNHPLAGEELHFNIQLVEIAA